LIVHDFLLIMNNCVLTRLIPQHLTPPKPLAQIIWQIPRFLEVIFTYEASYRTGGERSRDIDALWDGEFVSDFAVCFLSMRDYQTVGAASRTGSMPSLT
jgi:hypothetical protein